jgi:nitroreductase
MISVNEAIRSRKSVRSYLKKSVSIRVIKEILYEASFSPSGSNTQPWNVHVLTGNKLKDFTNKSKKEFLRNSDVLTLERLNYMKKYREPYKTRRRKVGWDLYQILDIKKGEYKKTKTFHAQNYEFFGAPMGLIFSIEKDLGWMSWLDYGMFIQNICLLARNYGLHTCPQAAWGLIYKKANKLLGLKENFTVHCGMAIGYENDKAPINKLKTSRDEVSVFCEFMK